MGRGNLFILPIRNPKDPPAIEVSPTLAKLVTRFANPSEDSIYMGYQMLLNSLPPPAYKKIVSCEHWVHNTWVPNIVVIEDPKKLPPNLMALQPGYNAPIVAKSKVEAERKAQEEEAQRKAEEEQEAERVAKEEANKRKAFLNAANVAVVASKLKNAGAKKTSLKNKSEGKADAKDTKAEAAEEMAPSSPSKVSRRILPELLFFNLSHIFLSLPLPLPLPLLTTPSRSDPNYHSCLCIVTRVALWLPTKGGLWRSGEATCRSTQPPCANYTQLAQAKA